MSASINFATVQDARQVRESGGSLKDYAYRTIVEQICSGELRPDTIFTERQLIDLLNISKAPIREALVQLCHEEILRSIPRCGYQVIQVSRKNIRELTELRLFLEVSSLPHVLDHLNEDKIHQLKQMCEERLCCASPRTALTAWESNVKFHLALNACAENAQVTKALKRALSSSTRAYAQAYQDQPQLLSPPREIIHDNIIRALERSELYTAQSCLREDILLTEQTILQIGPSKESF